jgi:hypothetical protein
VLLDARGDAELLVAGSRGHGGFTGMLIGSVSEHVVAHAACRVVAGARRPHRLHRGADPDYRVSAA